MKPGMELYGHRDQGRALDRIVDAYADAVDQDERDASADRKPEPSSEAQHDQENRDEAA
jgi:hypothetical protein